MRQISVKILSSILSLILVFSTVSFAVERHECGGKITDIAVFGDVERCSPKMEMKDCDTALPNTLSFNKHTCCKDLSQIVQSSIVVEKSTIKMAIEPILLPTIIIIPISLFEGLKENIIPFRDYTPPLIVSDISILQQTFLI